MPGQAAPSRVARLPRLQPPVVKWEGAELGRSRGEPAGRSPAGAGSAHWRGRGQSLMLLATRAGPLRQNGLLRRLDVAGRKRRQRKRGKGGGRMGIRRMERRGLGESGCEPGGKKEKTMGRRILRRAARGPWNAGYAEGGCSSNGSRGAAILPHHIRLGFFFKQTNIRCQSLGLPQPLSSAF